LFTVGRNGIQGLKSSERDRATDLLSVLRTQVNMTARTGGNDELLSRLAELLSDQSFVNPLVQIELGAYAVLGARMRDRGNGNSELVARVHKRASMLGRWRGNEITLRLAILCAERDFGGLIAAYLEHRGVMEPDKAVLSDAAYALALALSKTGETRLEQEAIDAGVAQASKADRSAELHVRAMWGEHAGRIIDVVRENVELQARMRRIILFDHHDWSRPLGHALSRSLSDEKMRAMLFDRLGGSDVAARISDDGPAIVQSALSGGGLSTLIGAIIEIGREMKIEQPAGQLPATVFDLAAALRAWHNANLPALDTPP
jgi:hypothetical protein